MQTCFTIIRLQLVSGSVVHKYIPTTSRSHDFAHDITYLSFYRRCSKELGFASIVLWSGNLFQLLPNAWPKSKDVVFLSQPWRRSCAYSCNLECQGHPSRPRIRQ